MIEALISLIIFVAVVAIVWYLVKWLLTFVPTPSIISTIVDIVAAVVVVIAVLRFLATLI